MAVKLDTVAVRPFQNMVQFKVVDLE